MISLGTFIDTAKYFSLEELNHCILSHNYGYSELATKPNSISRGTGRVDYHVKQKGRVGVCAKVLTYIQSHASLYASDTLAWSTVMHCLLSIHLTQEMGYSNRITHLLSQVDTYMYTYTYVYIQLCVHAL